MAFVKKTWVFEDIIDEDELNRMETQYDEAKADLDAHKIAAVLDHPDGSVTDAKFGNRTIDDTIVAASGADTPTRLWSKLGYVLKTLMGTANWWTLPSMTIAAIITALGLKAPLASPTFTGTVIVPNQTVGDNSTKAANTAFVEAARVILAAATALKAPIANPDFTGGITLPYGAIIKFKDIGGVAQTFLQHFNGNTVQLGSAAYKSVITYNNTLDDASGNLTTKGAVSIMPQDVIASSWSQPLYLQYRDPSNVLRNTFIQVGPTGNLTLDGTKLLWHDGNSAASKAVNGYQKLGSGLIIQWGVLQIASGSTITFPIAFPTTASSLTATPGGGVALTCGASNITSTNFIVQHGNGATSTFVQWMAIGW